ncbi:hypothetical protein NQ318_023152 [Aromia moschata]|uniref:Uncharacterized protein n=1 Tax=Aromia moschata TaxID=1265417 RepID=A0AAV8X024_9CUCU|nr:hypothetical protein NQ318_023152 [Aromia moschata]
MEILIVASVSRTNIDLDYSDREYPPPPFSRMLNTMPVPTTNGTEIFDWLKSTVAENSSVNPGNNNDGRALNDIYPIALLCPNKKQKSPLFTNPITCLEHECLKVVASGSHSFLIVVVGEVRPHEVTLGALPLNPRHSHSNTHVLIELPSLLGGTRNPMTEVQQLAQIATSGTTARCHCPTNFHRADMVTHPTRNPIERYCTPIIEKFFNRKEYSVMNGEVTTQIIPTISVINLSINLKLNALVAFISDPLSDQLFVPNNTVFSPRRWILDDEPIGWVMSCVLREPFQMDHLRLASWRQLDAVDQRLGLIKCNLPYFGFVVSRGFFSCFKFQGSNECITDRGVSPKSQACCISVSTSPSIKVWMPICSRNSLGA